MIVFILLCVIFFLVLGKVVTMSLLLLTKDTLLITQHFGKVHSISDTALMVSSFWRYVRSVTVLCEHHGRFCDLYSLLLKNVYICYVLSEHSDH